MKQLHIGQHVSAYPFRNRKEKSDTEIQEDSTAKYGTICYIHPQLRYVVILFEKGYMAAFRPDEIQPQNSQKRYC